MKKMLIILISLFFACSSVLYSNKNLVGPKDKEIHIVFYRLNQIQIGMNYSDVEKVFSDSIDVGIFASVRISRNICDRSYYTAEDYQSITYSIGYFDGYEQQCRTVAMITCINGKVDSIYYP